MVSTSMWSRNFYADLKALESHVVAHDVELLHPAKLCALHKVRHEEVWIVKLAVHVPWQGESQVSGVAIAIQHVEDGAAGSFVGLEEDDVVFGPAGATFVMG